MILICLNSSNLIFDLYINNTMFQPSLEHFEQHINYVRFCLASPDEIRSRSERILSNGHIVGEVTKPETTFCRTLGPEMDGLFCEGIFSPVKYWECHCGKCKRFDIKELYVKDVA